MLMALAFAGVLNPVVVLVLAAVSGLVRPSDMGLRGALIADTMPANLLTGAMSFSRTTSDTARISGALTGAGLFAAFGMGPAYIAITALYALGSLLTWFAAPESEAPCQPRRRRPCRPIGLDRPARRRRAYLEHAEPAGDRLARVAVQFHRVSVDKRIAALRRQGHLPHRPDRAGLFVASIGFGALLGALVMTWFGAEVRLSRLMFIAAVIWHVLILVFIQMPTSRRHVMLFLCGVARA